MQWDITMKKIIWVVLILLASIGLCLAQQEQDIQTHTEDFYTSYLLQQGFSYYQMQNYKEAISYFEQVYQSDPDNEQLKKALSACYFQLAAQFYKKNNLPQSKKYFFSALNYYPLFEIYQNLALVLVKLKEYNKAEEIAQKGLKIKPDSKELLLILVECYQQEKDHKKMLDIFQKLHQYYPDDLEIALNLGVLYRINRQAHNAMELYRKLKTQYPQERRIYECMAEIQSSGFKYKEARETYEELVKYYPNDTSILFKIAKFYTLEKKYEEARTTYRDILKLKEGDLDAYRGIVETYEKQKDIDSAVVVFKEAMDKNKDSLIILKELGRLYEEKGSITQAEITYKKMIDIKDDEPYAYIKLGLLSEEKDKATATTYFNKACELKASVPLPYYKLAISYKNDKDNNDALYYTKIAIEKALKQIKEIKGSLLVRFKGIGEGNINFTELAELSAAAKELEEPQKILEESLVLLIELRDKEEGLLLADLKEFLEDYRHSESLLGEVAKIYQDKKDYNTALVFLEKAVESNKDKKEPYLNIAICYENLGKENEAVNSYKRIIELDKTCNSAYEGLIRIYKKQGRLNELVSQWQKMTNVIDNPMMKEYLEKIKQNSGNEPKM